MIEHFERCWPWLAAALEHAGNTHSKEHLRDLIAKGDVNFHPLPHGAMTTYFSRHPTGLRDMNFWLAGGDLKEIARGEELLSRWAQEVGCDRSIINGRIGWKRALPGYRVGATVLVKELR